MLTHVLWEMGEKYVPYFIGVFPIDKLPKYLVALQILLPTPTLIIYRESTGWLSVIKKEVMYTLSILSEFIILTCWEITCKGLNVVVQFIIIITNIKKSMKKHADFIA